MSAAKPYLQEWHHKMFIREMEAKGKMDRHVTEAKERKEKVYYETTDRVFPGPLGQDAVLDRLVKNAEQRIDDTKKKHPNAVGVTFVEPVLGSTQVPGNKMLKIDRTRRRELQEKLAQMEAELQSERQQRANLEDQLRSVRIGSSGDL